jgi:L-lactate dehydrogenase (cytochrome)
MQKTRPSTGTASFADLRDAARKRLPRLLFDYIDGGSYNEETLRRNVDDFAKVTLEQRVMRDVSAISTEVELLGQKLSMPVVLSPVGLAGMYARRGEVQAAAAAKRAGIPFCLSSVSICGAGEVKRDGGAAPWFQLYMIKDRAYMTRLLKEAWEHGCPVLVFTVDLPVPAARLRDGKTGMSGPPSIGQFLQRAFDGFSHPKWMWDVWMRGRPHSFGNFEAGIPEARSVDDFWGWVGRNFQPKITWSDLDWLRQQWPGPIVLKGILHADDARQAIDYGIDGIVVSNHGGRQLDGAPSSISALPAVVEAVAGRIPVLMDGGIRSGTDVLKALSLGAQACLIGRAWAMALAAGGSNAVSDITESIRAELRTAMALSGCTDVRHAHEALVLPDPARHPFRQQPPVDSTVFQPA